MSWKLLERFIESDHFNNDPSLSVAYLSRYADHVGIHYVLCSKLRQFAYEEIEFFLPQLCHLLISIDNESMALEEFVLDLCEESVNGALLTFWLFQTYLHDLSGNPQSNAFKTCRRIYNKVQHIVFGGSDAPRREKIKENILPVTVLASIVLAGVAAPFLPRHAGPLAIAQARKPRPTEETISEVAQNGSAASPKISRSNTVAGRASGSGGGGGGSGADTPRPRKPARQASGGVPSSGGVAHRPALLATGSAEGRASVSSLPDMQARSPRSPGPPFVPTPPATAGLVPKGLSLEPGGHGGTAASARRKSALQHQHQQPLAPRPLTPSSLSRAQKVRMLRANYFRAETQFLSALEDVSNRLVVVPKAARLSALRAELALIAQDLPAEVDVPTICPPTLVDGSAGRSRHHRIVRLNPAEATSLNSAERVPYLLMVEVLKEDFDFDPETECNRQLLARLLAEKGAGPKRRLFDITDAPRDHHVHVPEAGEQQPDPLVQDSVFEPANGDLGSSSLLKDPLEDELMLSLKKRPRSTQYSPADLAAKPPTAVAATASNPGPHRSSSGANTSSSMTTLSTPRTSDMEVSRSSSPMPRRMTLPVHSKTQGPDQPDFSALATHMRTAAQMLAQLDSSSSKRPRVEVAAIKAKIIASMQSLEEQSFVLDEGNNAPTFDSIMANANAAAAAAAAPESYDDEGVASGTDPRRGGAGAARMENDQKTGGVQRRGDRDDPSAATFGEEWAAKKERIRRTSPYGTLPGWDLVSVIVKTGTDLRQEAFACQLIEVCAKIWADAGVGVWVKRMRILVTGESSGLIETITNGVSLHSLKRSLTLASVAAGRNPRRRVATLRDHFERSFGEPEGDAHAAAVAAFARSLAAYSVLQYVLQLKDRHNGNILVDNAGHIVHIDFGFMLSNSPGSVGFEAAPFKLTQEYVDVLGGVGAPAWNLFKRLCKAAFQALRKDAERLVGLVEMMGRESRMPCFAAGGQQATGALRSRFVLQLSREEAEGFVEELIGKSLGSYYTRLYDTFQYRTQGIY
ncbi:kinase-like domain-containing protein [Lineolata rhizophorae]|uniref:1-phosphatidylinositol 4-kinase n=1 Tax=Lineolata rhizophorae TaxID=578093 RepID=A0A6A6NYA7_9PEZI|nr:kinase-like domain-containing protein [Lineolata rhizophorae]